MSNVVFISDQRWLRLVGGVAKCDEPLAVGQRYWILEFALPAVVSHALLERGGGGISNQLQIAPPSQYPKLGDSGCSGSEEIPKSRELSDDLLR
jgi:hypothetical protein